MQDQGKFLSGVALAIGIVIAAWLGSNAYITTHQTDQTISVTGSAKRRIVSDRIEWTAQISSKSKTMSEAYKKITQQIPQVVEYLVKKGIDKKNIEISSVSTEEQHPQNNQGVTLADVISGYQMHQLVTVKSNNVEAVAKIARESTELINQGIYLESHPPKYYYTKLGDLKVEMMSETAKDAKQRAEQIASSTGAKVGVLRSARMGVLQINPADSTATTYEGNNDVSALEKDIIAVISGSFALAN